MYAPDFRQLMSKTRDTTLKYLVDTAKGWRKEINRRSKALKVLNKMDKSMRRAVS